MSASYGRLQILVHPPRSRVTQHYKILQFNTRGRGRVVRGRNRGYVGIGHGFGRVHGGQGGRGGRSYGNKPCVFSISHRIFVAEACV